MQALKIGKPGELVFEEIPIPEIEDNEVLVETKCCGICGSDVHGTQMPGIIPEGAFLGHEISGIIARVGKDVNNWQPMDRVVISPGYYCGDCWACQHGFIQCCAFQVKGIGISTENNLPGGFAQFIRVPIPERQLYLLPDKVSFEEGALVEPLATSLHAVRLSAYSPLDPVMVLGAGAIGLGVVIFLKNVGARLIIVTEVNEKRSEVARSLGADYVFNPSQISDLRREVFNLTDGLGVAKVFDCSGIPEAFRSAPSFLRPKGQIILTGIIQREVPFVPFSLNLGEFQIQATMVYADEFPKVIDFLQKTKVPIQEIVTSKIKLHKIIEQGFNRLLTSGHNEIKILVEPEN
jgi:threonine dehydrogenase-like Zn-dependent dehydrogenase